MPIVIYLRTFRRSLLLQSAVYSKFLEGVISSSHALPKFFTVDFIKVFTQSNKQGHINYNFTVTWYLYYSYTHFSTQNTGTYYVNFINSCKKCIKIEPELNYIYISNSLKIFICIKVQKISIIKYSLKFYDFIGVWRKGTSEYEGYAEWQTVCAEQSSIKLHPLSTLLNFIWFLVYTEISCSCCYFIPGNYKRGVHIKVT